VARRRLRRRREKEQRHTPKPIGIGNHDVREPSERLVYSREQAAQALGISLATLDRRVVPAITTVKTEWGARLIPAAQLEGYLAERIKEPSAPRRRAAPSGRKSTIPPEVIDRMRHEHAHGTSLAEIARGLNRDRIPTGQGGRRWWPSTVRVVLKVAPARVALHQGDGRWGS
jgi:hypothetical protein